MPRGFEKVLSRRNCFVVIEDNIWPKTSAFKYWKVLLEALKAVGPAKSKVDPCVYFRWVQNGINIWVISWVDDLLLCEHNHDVTECHEAIKQYFDLNEIGELKEEYVGYKVEYDQEDSWMKLKQPVLL